jgi:hypothetical protein
MVGIDLRFEECLLMSPDLHVQDIPIDTYIVRLGPFQYLSHLPASSADMDNRECCVRRFLVTILLHLLHCSPNQDPVN